MKIYLELQTKKHDMKEAAKRRKLNMEGATQSNKLAIEATNTDTKAKEVVLATMSVNLTNMSPKRRNLSANRQKDTFDQDGLN